MAISRSVDVLILGGGPAGTTAGTLLAREGIATTLLEMESGPRLFRGESMLPHTLPLLDRLGIREAVSNLPHTRVSEGETFLTHDGNRKVVYWFDQAFPPALPHAYQIRRDELSAVMLENARQAGVEVLSGWHATTPLMEGPRCIGVLARDGHGNEHAVTCRVLLDASGQSSFLASRMGWRFPYPLHRKVASVSHFQGVWLPEGRERGNTAIVATDGGWFWLVPLADGVVSVGVVLDLERWRDSEGKAETAFQAAVSRTPEVERRLRDARSEGPFTAVQNFSYRVMKVAGEGFCLVGDAAGFVDPVFSTGLFRAVAIATAAAQDICEALHRHGRVESSDLGPTIALTRSLNRIFSSLIRAFYDPHFLALFFDPRPHLGIPQAMSSLLAADVLRSGRWRLSTRYRALRVLSHIQEWRATRGHPLVEPLAAAPRWSR